ncbi:hypothetical protein B0H16DRAFT_1887773 [Mycena metata]|uniref:Uncharacterized protein n=1 Tax=Mycena metata TaxID=1033252 RepID=A0AAD7IU83_9AGAR|nr:hypothetical protein B0H16DRAFT_1887773 [Mycena metata]
MAPKRKRDEREEAPPNPEEDELEEEGELDSGAGAGDEAARLKLEATRRRKREYMQRQRAKRGEEERAKSKAAMRTFRSQLTGTAKEDYRARQNLYKATYRQRKAEGAGPAPRGRRIKNDLEDEEEPEEEPEDERHVIRAPPPPAPARLRAPKKTTPLPPAGSRAPKKTKAASSSQAKPPPKRAPKGVSAAAPSKAGRKRKRPNDDTDVEPLEPETEEELEVQARHPKRPAKIPAKRQARAKGNLPDAPTTDEDPNEDLPPPLTMSLRGRHAPAPPAPPAPAPPAPPAPAPPAPPESSARKSKYHPKRCGRLARCLTSKGGKIPLEYQKPKHFTFSKWVEYHPFPFLNADGTPAHVATFEAAMLNFCHEDLRYYRQKLLHNGRVPGILDTYLTEDEESPKEEEQHVEEEQNAGSIDLDIDELTPRLKFLPFDSPTPFHLQRTEEEDEGRAEGFFDPDEPPRGLSPPKPFESIIPTLASRAATPTLDSISPTPASRAVTPTLGAIHRNPSRGPSPFPVSPEQNALAPPERNDYGTPPEEELEDGGADEEAARIAELDVLAAELQAKRPAPPIDSGSPEELLDYGTPPEEELEDGGEDEEAARVARLNVNAAELHAYRASLHYDKRFDPLLYKPTAPTSLDVYDHNASKERSTGEILQIKKELVEGFEDFEEGASGVGSAEEPLPARWWEVPEMPWTPKDYAYREQKAKDGTWRRAFNSGQFFIIGVHRSRRDAGAAARIKGLK